MTHLVCFDCRYPFDAGGFPEFCTNCGVLNDYSNYSGKIFSTKIEAEAYAASLWLADGYHVHDFRDPYFKPRR